MGSFQSKLDNYPSFLTFRKNTNKESYYTKKEDFHKITNESRISDISTRKRSWIGGNFQSCLSNEWGRFSLNKQEHSISICQSTSWETRRNSSPDISKMRKKVVGCVFATAERFIFGENCIMLVVLMMSAHYPNIQGKV